MYLGIQMKGNSKENKSVQQVLKETAEKFRSLTQEADAALEKSRDTKAHHQKLRERARLLVDLPDRLSVVLEETDIDSERKENIMRDIKWFAKNAQEALHRDNNFVLGVLLIDQGSKIGDKNHLEELISALEAGLS